MLILLATLATADPGPAVCMTPGEFADRVLLPLAELERCRAEVDITAAERDGLAVAASRLASEVEREREARTAAEERARRARRSRPAWAAGGAGAVVVALLVLVLL